MFNSLRDKLRRLQLRLATLKSTSHSRLVSSEEAKLRLFLNQYRRHLNSMPDSGSTQQTASRKRYAKKKSRSVLRTFRKGKRPRLPLPLLLSKRYSENKLAGGLLPGRKELWLPILQRRHSEKFNQIALKDFSFIDHPQHTLDLLREILVFEANAIEAQLHFDDEYCVDVSAYLTLAEMWPYLANVFRGGRMALPIQKVVEALQLRKDLKMKFPGLKNVDDVWAFPKQQRRPAGSSRSAERFLEPQTREKVVDEFCDAFDEWLETAADELELSPQGKARFGEIIGELLDNAERHSSPPGKDGGWSTAAFMAKRTEDDKDIYRCHMGFLSVGASIAESLALATIDTRARINKYLDLHKDKGISRATLTTLVALQDGITRDHSATENNRGGVGFQEVLELINAIGVSSDPGHAPRMTIVSGSSCIQARAPYVIGMRNDSLEPRTLWFNEANNPYEVPDKDFVFDLNSHFPGTIIGLTFVLSKEDLMAVLNANRAD